MKKIYVIQLVLIIIVLFSFMSTPVFSQSLWNITFNEQSEFTKEELESMLNQAYQWLVSQNLSLASPCNSTKYNIVIDNLGGPLAGLTRPYIVYYPDTGEVDKVCIQEIIFDFVDRGPDYQGASRHNYGELYVREAKMTIVHELFHAVQYNYMKYVLDDQTERRSEWIFESSAEAIEYLYEPFIMGFAEKDNQTIIYHTRLYNDIQSYFLAGLYEVNPNDFSLQNYETNYDKLYYYSPVFIDMFTYNGINVIKDILSSKDPSSSKELRDGVTEFLVWLPLGFYLGTENTTIAFYPNGYVYGGDEITLTVPGLSAIYLYFNGTDGYYNFSFTDNPIVIVGSQYSQRPLIFEGTPLPVEKGDLIGIINPTTDSMSIDFQATYVSPLDQTRTMTITKQVTTTMTIPVTTTITRTHNITQITTKTEKMVETTTVTQTQTTTMKETITLTSTIPVTITKTLSNIGETGQKQAFDLKEVLTSKEVLLSLVILSLAFFLVIVSRR